MPTPTIITPLMTGLASLATAAGLMPIAQALEGGAAVAIKWTALALAMAGCAALARAVKVLWDKIDEINKENESRLDAQEARHRAEREIAEQMARDEMNLQREKHDVMTTKLLNAHGAFTRDIKVGEDMHPQDEHEHIIQP